MCKYVCVHTRAIFSEVLHVVRLNRLQVPHRLGVVSVFADVKRRGVGGASVRVSVVLSTSKHGKEY